MNIPRDVVEVNIHQCSPRLRRIVVKYNAHVSYLGFFLRLTVSLSVDSFGGDGSSASGSSGTVSVF